MFGMCAVTEKRVKDHKIGVRKNDLKSNLGEHMILINARENTENLEETKVNVKIAFIILF